MFFTPTITKKTLPIPSLAINFRRDLARDFLTGNGKMDGGKNTESLRGLDLSVLPSNLGTIEAAECK